MPEKRILCPLCLFSGRLSHKLTYEQVSRFPLDSFQRMRHREIVQLGFRRGTMWLRFLVDNQTSDDLFLISSYRHYNQFTVFVRNSGGSTSITRSGYSTNLANQQILPISSSSRMMCLARAINWSNTGRSKANIQARFSVSLLLVKL